MAGLEGEEMIIILESLFLVKNKGKIEPNITLLRTEGISYLVHHCKIFNFDGPWYAFYTLAGV